ncbi:MAG: acetyl-CoA carboxylase biotin carboxyl carrier protein subunit [Acidobacteriota bacterium]
MKIEALYQERTWRIEIEEVQDSSGDFRIRIDDKTHALRLLSRSQDRFTLEIHGNIEDILMSREGDHLLINWRNQTCLIQAYNLKDRLLHSGAPEASGAAVLKALMPGKVICVLRKAGDSVRAGEGLATIEAMKMQNEMKSPKSGIIRVCNVETGAFVNAGDVLFEIE